MKIAKADLVPTQANLLPAYGSFAELEAACAAFTVGINARPHRVTRRAPVEMLAEEASRLHPLPAAPFTAAFGVTRTVGENTPMTSFEAAQYSVPHHGSDVVVVQVGEGGPVEVARHQGRGRALPAGAGWGAAPHPATQDHQRGGVFGVGRRGCGCG